MPEKQDVSLTLGICFSSIRIELERALGEAEMAPELIYYPVDIVSRPSIARAVSTVLAEQRSRQLAELLPGLKLAPYAELPLNDQPGRVRNVLLNGWIRTVQQLGEKTVGELWSLRNCGVKSVHDICSMAVEIHLAYFKASFAPESSEPQDHRVDELADPPGKEIWLRVRKAALTLAQLKDSLGVVASWATEMLEGNKLADILSLREDVEPLPDDVRDALSAFLSTRLSALTEQPKNEWADFLVEVLPKLPPRERRIFEERELGKHGKTLRELGEEFGVTRERIRQIQGDVAQEIRDALTHPKLAPFRWRLLELESVLGSGLPENSRLLEGALAKALCDIDPSIVSPEFLLWAAGPYRLREGWWLKDDTEIPRIDADCDVLADGPAISDEAVFAKTRKG